MEHLCCATFKALSMLWERRHDHKARQNGSSPTGADVKVKAD